MAACFTPSAITRLPYNQTTPSIKHRWPACTQLANKCAGNLRTRICAIPVSHLMYHPLGRNAPSSSSYTLTVCRPRILVECSNEKSTGMELREAARQTVDLFVRSNMVIGLGSGPGSCMAIEYIGQKLKEGTLQDVTGVPTSALCAAEAANCGVPLTTLEEHPKLAFGFTDADIVQEGTLYSVIGRKGVNGRDSVYQEKMVAAAADQFLVLVKEDNFVEELEGEIPVLIQTEEWEDIAEEIDDTFIGDAEVWRRPSSGSAGPLGGDFPLVTEQGHFVLDVVFTTKIEDPRVVASSLDNIPGVAGHGLLLDLAYGAAVACPGGVKIRTSLFKEAFTTRD